ncbi:MAG TPA: hypothetical protein VJC09_01670 [Candidatus Saccharimonadales bacterium]|nr:hypothetical protein [Candidatus Saccharimonadales bacterium]
MKHSERKYRVKDFKAIKQKLTDVHAQKIKQAVTTHYYAQLIGNDVIKLVHYEDRDEIHKLKEANGAFTLTDRIPVVNAESGLKWLKQRGHTETSKIIMAYEEYSYKGGIVGLYVINDDLYSVILDYPPRQFVLIEKQFNLDKAEVIDMPYNKYIQNNPIS